LHHLEHLTDYAIAYYDNLGEKVKAAFPIMGNALENDVKIISDDLKTFLKD
jgi:hypothetical protein